MPCATTTILARFDCGYHAYNRVWSRWAASKTAGRTDYFGHGTLVSPAGAKWRFYGMGAGCPRFFRDGVLRDVAYGVVLRAMLAGWRWVPDSDLTNRKFTVTRWPDGNHFYVHSEDGSTITFQGRHKFNTAGEAETAGKRWQEANHLGA